MRIITARKSHSLVWGLITLAVGGWAVLATISAAEGAAPAYVLVVDASGSMVSTRRADLFDPAREPGQTRWAFMLAAIERFLGSLEEGSELYLQIFADAPLEPIPYVMDREGQRVAEIVRDIEQFHRTPAFAGYAARHPQKGHPRGWSPRKQFVQRTALYETVLAVTRLVKSIAQDDPTRPIDILFYADGMEDAAGYRDKRLAAVSPEERGRIVSEEFERLVREQGYRNTWLYFTWIVNKSQFGEIYRKALTEGGALGELDPQTKALLSQRPLISTPDNHIVYDLPYPRLSVAVAPREIGLANPRDKPTQKLRLRLSYSEKAAQFLDGHPLGLKILGPASSWLKVADGPQPMRRGEVEFRLKVADQGAVRRDRSYEAEAELIYPDPERVGGAKAMGPPRVHLRFAALKPPQLEVRSPRPDGVYSTSSPVRFEASAPNASIEWRLEGATVLQGEQVVHRFAQPRDALELEVVARDKDHPEELVTRRAIRLQVEDVRIEFDRVPDDAALQEGRALEIAVRSSVPLDAYRWSINFSDPKVYGAEVARRPKGEPGSVLRFSPEAAGPYAIRAVGSAERFPKLEVAAQPDPLRLEVRPMPQITWAAPHTDRHAYQTSPAEAGVALRVEVYGLRYDQVEWQLTPDPAGVDFPAKVVSGLKSLESGWRVAETVLPPVTEEMGIRGLRVVARATSNAPGVAPLETSPFELSFFSPERDLVVVSPPQSADLHFDEGEVAFEADIIGPPPQKVRWELFSPEGTRVAVSEEPVAQGSDGRQASHFRYPFSDPDYRYRQPVSYQLKVTGLYPDGKSISGQQGKVEYKVRHVPKAFRLAMDGNPAAIAYDQRMPFKIRQVGIESEVAPDLKTVVWRLTDAKGNELTAGQSDASRFLIDLGAVSRPTPYGDLVLQTRVRQRSGEESVLPPMALNIAPRRPEVKILVDGEERSAVNLIFGEKLTVQDRSTGDIVSRRWVVRHQDPAGNLIAEQPFGEPYVADLPVESRPWAEPGRSEYRVALVVTDPEGREHGAHRWLQIALVPPRPWWLLVIGLLLSLPYFRYVLWPFLGNQPMRWAIRFSERDRAEGIGGEERLGAPSSICADWDRRRKRARRPMSRFSADDYWKLGNDGYNATLEVRSLRGLDGEPEAAAAIVYERTAKDPQAPERRILGTHIDEFWFAHPNDERRLFLVRIVKEAERRCLRVTWDRVWLSLLVSILAAAWGGLLWYVLG